MNEIRELLQSDVPRYALRPDQVRKAGANRRRQRAYAGVATSVVAVAATAGLLNNLSVGSSDLDNAASAQSIGVPDSLVKIPARIVASAQPSGVVTEVRQTAGEFEPQAQPFALVKPADLSTDVLKIQAESAEFCGSYDNLIVHETPTEVAIELVLTEPLPCASIGGSPSIIEVRLDEPVGDRRIFAVERPEVAPPS